MYLTNLAVSLWFLWYFHKLPINYYYARKIGVPVVVTPLDLSNLIWLLFFARYETALSRWLPRPIWSRLRMSSYGWEHVYRYEVNEMFGPAYVLVTPSASKMWIADAELAKEILARREDFLQEEISQRILFTFGPNLIGSNGTQWQRHRRMINPLFRERIMEVAWNESQSQTSQMLSQICARPPVYTPTPVQTNKLLTGIRQISINLLSVAGFGHTTPWSVSEESAPPGYNLSFMQTVASIMSIFYLAAFIPQYILTLSFMPKAIRTLGVSVSEFPRHVNEMIARERTNTTTNSPTNADAEENDSVTTERVKKALNPPSLLSGFITRTTEKGTLTPSEIIGNLFGFCFAGYESTASTIEFAVCMLAISPTLQDWLIEEIDHVESLDPSFSYATCFAKLQRVRALMYETLRLHPPFLRLIRQVNTPQTTSPTPLTPALHIPIGTQITISPALIHVSSSWSDALSFTPERWLAPELPSNTLSTSPSPSPSHNLQPTVLEPGRKLVEQKAAFMPWGSGPRICPGSKFSQVEFVAVITSILRKWRIEAVDGNGVGGEAAREKVRTLVEGAKPKLALQVDAERVRVRLVRRG